MQRTRISYLIEMANFSRIVRKVLKVVRLPSCVCDWDIVIFRSKHKINFSCMDRGIAQSDFGTCCYFLEVQFTDLKDWKEALPLHLRTANADGFEEPFWMTRQRESIQYHCEFSSKNFANSQIITSSLLCTVNFSMSRSHFPIQNSLAWGSHIITGLIFTIGDRCTEMYRCC